MNYLQYFIIILISYIRNYPIIKWMKKQVVTPIAFILEDYSTTNMLIDLLDIKATIISEAEGAVAMVKRLTNINSRAVFLKLGSSRGLSYKDKEKYDLFKGMISTGKIGNEQAVASGFLIFQTAVPREIASDVICIRIGRNDLMNVAIPSELDVIPDSFDLSRVMFEADKISQKEYGDFEVGMMTACTFLLPSLEKQETYNMEQFVKSVQWFSELIVDTSDTELILNQAKEEFFSFIKSGNITCVYRLPYLDEKAVADLSKAIFVSGDKLYLSDELLKKAFQNTIKLYSIVTVKDILAEAKILIRERGGFVKKMNYINAMGCSIRTRMIQFDTLKLVDEAGGTILDYLVRFLY